MRCILAFICLFFCETSSYADPSSVCRIAAVINNNVITKADLMNRLRFAAISSGLEPTSDNLDKIKEQMLRVLIDEQLQREVGKKYGIEIPAEHIKETIKDIESNNGMAEGSIAQMMKENNIPYKVFEDQIRAQLIWLVYIREKYPLKSLEDQIRKKYENDISPSLQIADWEVEQELTLQKEKETKTQYHLAEIFLPVDRSEQNEIVKNNMNQLIDELQKGAHFSALAQQFSQSSTASLGGDMGWLTEDQLESEIKEALSQLQPGQLSPPIRTSQGYTLIAYVERKLPSKEGDVLLSMQQILFPFPANATDEKVQGIMHQIDEIARTSKSCSELEKNAQKKFPTSLFKLINNESMSNFPEELQKVVNSLTINQASSPLLTPEGGLLLMVCNKRVEKAQVFSREDAIASIASRKHSLLARRELRDLKRHAFIDVRM